MVQKYDMYYVPTISANMMLFDFGKTKSMADTAKRTYESSRYDAETSIELVIYNVKVAYYNMLFAKKQKENKGGTVYENRPSISGRRNKRRSTYRRNKSTRRERNRKEYNRTE